MGKRGSKPKRREIEWSSNLAYAVGLIASDGCLSSSGRHLYFVSKDIEQVRNLRRCLALKAKIATHLPGIHATNKKYYRIQWGDVTLYEFLVNIGLTPKKSLTIGALSIPDEYFFKFLRGSFDGDGCFYSYFDSRWKSSFMFYLVFSSASHAHITWLRSSIARLASVQGHVTQNGKDSTLWNIKYAKRESMEVLKYLYPQSASLCLSRKRLKIERALRIVGKSLVKH